MDKPAGSRHWRTIFRGHARKVIVAALGALAICWVAFHVRSWLSEPFFRGRPASYWNRAFQAALDEGGDGYPAYPQQSWLTRWRVSLGLRHDDDDLRALLHGDDDPAAVPVLITFLHDPDVRVRSYVAFWVGFMKPAPKAMLPDLIVAAHDESASVRAGAVQSLGSMGAAAKGAVPDLIQALRDEDQKVVANAIYALGQIGPEAREAVPHLMPFLRSDDHRVRGDTAYALGGIGPEARAAVPYLVEVLMDENMSVSDSAYYALEKNDPQALAEAMRRREGKR